MSPEDGRKEGEDKEPRISEAPATATKTFACVTKLCLRVVLFCRELREKIQPEIMELIKQQRLNRLCEGTCFRKISSRRRQGETAARAPAGIPGSARLRRSGFSRALILGRWWRWSTMSHSAGKMPDHQVSPSWKLRRRSSRLHFNLSLPPVRPPVCPSSTHEINCQLPAWELHPGRDVLCSFCFWFFAPRFHPYVWLLNVRPGFVLTAVAQMLPELAHRNGEMKESR